MRDAQTNAVANTEGAVPQAVFFDDVPGVVRDGVDEELGGTVKPCNAVGECCTRRKVQTRTFSAVEPLGYVLT